MTPPVKKTALTQIDGLELKRFVIQSALLSLIDPVRGKPTRNLLDEDPDDDAPGGQQVARKEMSSMVAEHKILHLVVELDRGRIWHMAEKLERGGIQDFLQQTRSKFHAVGVKGDTQGDIGLRAWLESCPFMSSPLSTWDNTTMAKLIDWSAKARWHYDKQIQQFLESSENRNQSWLDTLHKIARYHAAIKSMVKLAVKQPLIFTSIRIQELKAPSQRLFSLRQEKTQLQNTVRYLVKEDLAMVMEKLKQHLGTRDTEGGLRKACCLKLTLHAEMQLVVFYEEHQNLLPKIPFMGTSKKACFLCHEYLVRHPLGLKVSACHQKIYRSWMPPPYHPLLGGISNYTFAKLSRSVEQLTRRELKTALTEPRRPRNQDSTAGPSLTETATMTTEQFGSHMM